MPGHEDLPRLGRQERSMSRADALVAGAGRERSMSRADALAFGRTERSASRADALGVFGRERSKSIAPSGVGRT